MKILLTYPEVPDTFWSFKHALPFIGKKATLPPLGLVTVATMLPNKWEKRLVDMNTRALKDEEIRWADYVLISAMAVQRESTRKLIDHCKSLGTRIIAGGPLFTAEPELFQDVDHLVLNEAEITLPRFLADLEQGCAKRVYQTEGQEFADTTTTPIPMWSLLEMKHYASMAVQFSRGCPHNCEFCNIKTLLGRRPRIKTAEQIIAELDALRAAGWNGKVFFVDDNFIGNKRYLKDELLPALIEWQKGKKGMPFYTEATINLADDEMLMDMMVEAGFNAVFVGIETPDECALAETGKSQNIGRDLQRDIRTLIGKGFEVQGGFIVGFDSDRPPIFERMRDFIQSTGITTAMVGKLAAMPGTDLFERLKLADRLKGLVSGDNVDGSTNIIPVMGEDALHKGYQELMRHLYTPKHYYKRIRKLLREYSVPKYHSRVEFQHILAFFRAWFWLGIWGKERFQYWKLFWWTLFKRPRLIPLAVTLAIYGRHFRLICEKHIL